MVIRAPHVLFPGGLVADADVAIAGGGLAGSTLRLDDAAARARPDDAIRACATWAGGVMVHDGLGVPA